MASNKARPLTASQRAALSRVQGLIEYWRITADEIEAAATSAPATAHAPAAGVKYEHPVTHETWDGAGPQPEWLRRALLQEGYLVRELQPAAQATSD
jgi:DNA-binding protein H-NS